MTGHTRFRIHNVIPTVYHVNMLLSYSFCVIVDKSFKVWLLARLKWILDMGIIESVNIDFDFMQRTLHWLLSWMLSHRTYM